MRQRLLFIGVLDEGEVWRGSVREGKVRKDGWRDRGREEGSGTREGGE